MKQRRRQGRQGQHRFFNPFPKHLQVREILMRRIERDFEVGQQFPTEKQLCDEFGVSRLTVREALGWLEREGLLSRHRGQGTFVTKQPGKLDERLTGFTEDFTELRLDTEAEIIEMGEVKPPPELGGRLGQESGVVYHIVRLRLFEKIPLSLHESYLPLELGPKVAQADLRRKFIVSEIEKELDLKLRESQHRIEAVVADTDTANLLTVPLGAPLLLMTRYYLLPDGSPILFSRSRYRADRYYYTVELDQNKNE